MDFKLLEDALAVADDMAQDYLHLSAMVTGEFAVGKAEHDAIAVTESEWESRFGLLVAAAREWLTHLKSHA